MKPKKIIFILLSVFVIQTRAPAQTEEVKKRWETQIDTNRVNPLKPEYLQLEKDVVWELFNKQPNYSSFSDKFGASMVVNPCKKAINTQLELTFRPSKRANQYLFLQWNQGYGESLLEYNRYTSMVWVGICMRLPIRNLY